MEQRDIASGTSGRSSRLIHGGLRYLEQLHFGLVHEALEERARLLRLAPHLVRLEPFLFPIYGIPLLHQGFYGAGIFLYDLLGARRDGGFAKHLRPSSAIEYAPDLRRKGLTGGIIYHDGVEDDARLALAVLRTALAGGAVAATRVRAEAPLLDGERLIGATVRDLVSENRFEVRAERVIDATGVWAADPEARFATLEGGDARSSRAAARTSSSAAIASRPRAGSRSGSRAASCSSSRGRATGSSARPTTPTRAGPSSSPRRRRTSTSCSRRSIAQLDVDLARGDIVGTYAGMRPLVGDPGGSTVKASREHRVAADASGLVRISGGKYTTYRVMARDVVDASLGQDGGRSAAVAAPRTCRSSARRRGRSSTRSAPSLERPLRDAAAARGQTRATWPARVARRLADRYGREAVDVMALARDLDLAVAARRGHRPPPGRGRVGGAPRARALDRRRARPPDAARPGAARIAARRSRRGSPRSSAPSSAGTSERQADEVDATTSETARREYGLPWATSR